MRTVASEIGFRERRGQVGMGTRAAALRKARRRTLALELLETRVLLATLPAITPDPNAPLPIDLAQAGSAPSGGATNSADGSILNPTTNTGTIENESSPTIAIDPNNPQKLVAVYTTHIKVVTTTTTTDTTTIEGAYSTNAGLSWTSFSVAPVKTIDPQTSAAFADITNATVAFDHNDNFYVASQENNANDETGAVFLERYSFTGASPSTDGLANAGASKIIFGPWDTRNADQSHAFGSVEPVARGGQRREQLHRPHQRLLVGERPEHGQRLRRPGDGHAGQRDDEQLQRSASLLEHTSRALRSAFP